MYFYLSARFEFTSLIFESVFYTDSASAILQSMEKNTKAIQPEEIPRSESYKNYFIARNRDGVDPRECSIITRGQLSKHSG